MIDPINNKGWKTLVEHPTPAIVLVVQEFFANAYEYQDYKVFVKGKTVSFDRTTISRYYKGKVKRKKRSISAI